MCASSTYTCIIISLVTTLQVFFLFNRKSSTKSCGCYSSVMNDYSKKIVNSVENSSPLASTWEDDPGACHLQRHAYVVCLIVLSVWIFSVVVYLLIWSQVICSPLTYVYQKWSRFTDDWELHIKPTYTNSAFPCNRRLVKWPTCPRLTFKITPVTQSIILLE